MNRIVSLMEHGMLPDAVIRSGIRRLLMKRLQEEERGDTEADRMRQREFFEHLRRSPLAVATAAANKQHYELPPDFFSLVLGPRRKYSCCLYPPGVDDLAAAEEAMLRLTCQRAGLADGMEILELGCGWGSLTLWMAEHYPDARITAVSNSAPQRQFIQGVCRGRGFGNVRVITADMNDFTIERTFDRVVSVEMFEHMRNYAELLRRISSWLKDDGRLFVHIFCHRNLAYLFQTDGEDDWMGRYFFTGGIMPSDHLLFYFNDHLAVEDHWRVGGRHYQRTCDDWLKRMDAERRKILEIFWDVYEGEAPVWFQRWRVFFMACSELFGYGEGNEWFVSHYLLRKNGTGALCGSRQKSLSFSGECK
ncbi:SAM-dependent methyltransferase [Geobacter sulfurreducens]|uniref:SAM-dependent methyltransferase n=1 Tax=Geobacter sulfurreducens TaxID=35554 RepID=UPI002C9D1C76|nr:cyclopropane-fatty-acyl-phospholipid synthase family protein [Geobacter sulfurreducens]HML78830.1 cyclopropane-fatty-acyl-phospholipid synthase family protein [Geobacter sulfurreducens]